MELAQASYPGGSTKELTTIIVITIALPINNNDHNNYDNDDVNFI